MRLALLSASLLAAFAGAAYAKPAAIIGVDSLGPRPVLVCERSETDWLRSCADRSSASAQARQVRVARQVFVCDRTAETRRSWVREFGAISFVTADELLAAEAANESWSSPRCITNAEMRRLARTTAHGASITRAMAVASGY